MFSFNLTPKLLFFLAMAMLLARKSNQQMPNATKIDYFKLAHELVDAAALENAELKNGWWKKYAFCILCDANFAKFELKMDEKYGKLRKNVCEMMKNDSSNENLLKIFVNDKEAFEDLMGFISNDKPFIDTKIILEKIKNSPILSNENQENFATMFEHLNAGTAIITQMIKSKSFTTTIKLMGINRRRRKRMNDNNNNNHNYGCNVNEIQRQIRLIRGRIRKAKVARENCVIGLIFLFVIYWIFLKISSIMVFAFVFCGICVSWWLIVAMVISVRNRFNHYNHRRPVPYVA